MKKLPILLGKNMGYEAPTELYKKILETYKGSVGCSVRVNDQELARLDDYHKGITLEQLLELQTGFKAEDMVLSFHPEVMAQVDSVQPHVVIERDNKIQLLGFFGGDFSQFAEVQSTHDASFFAVKKFLLPVLNQRFTDLGSDIDKFMDMVLKDNILKMTIENCIQGAGYIYFHALNGQQVMFDKGMNNVVDFDWGFVSDPCGYAVAAPVPSPAEMSTMDKIRAKLNLAPRAPIMPVLPEPPKATAPATPAMPALPAGVHHVPTVPAVPPAPATPAVPQTPAPQPAAPQVDKGTTIEDVQRQDAKIRVDQYGTEMVEEAPPASWVKNEKRAWYAFFGMTPPQGYNSRSVKVWVPKAKFEFLGKNKPSNEMAIAWERLVSGAPQAPAPTKPGTLPIHTPAPPVPAPVVPADSSTREALAVPLINNNTRKEIGKFFDSPMMHAILDKHKRNITDPAKFAAMEAQLPKMTDQVEGITWEEFLSLPFEGYAAFCRAFPDAAGVALKDLRAVIMKAGLSTVIPQAPIAPPQAPPATPTAPQPPAPPAPPPVAAMPSVPSVPRMVRVGK